MPEPQSESVAERLARRALTRVPTAVAPVKPRLPPEGAPAVAVRARRMRTLRNYRVNTDITPEAGALLDRITLHLRTIEGRRHRQNHSLERAIMLLAAELGIGAA
jgi:hypothetical protein